MLLSKRLSYSVTMLTLIGACKSNEPTSKMSAPAIAQENGGSSPTHDEFYAGGTAKPPRGGCIRGLCPPLTVPTSVIYTAAGPALPPAGVGPAGLAPRLQGVPPFLSGADNGFQISGHVQAVTVNNGCSGKPLQTDGGTITINGVVIVVPSDTIIQLPANTFTFADAFCPGNNLIAGSALAFDGSGGQPTPANVATGQPSPMLPSFEVSAIGNIVGANGTVANATSPHIAALLYASQHALNTGSGYIGAIDYNDGSIYVGSAGGGYTRLLINDPIGRYGRPQTSPDARFSVDTSNPTIKSGSTGYPMCVPRVAPSGSYADEKDQRCPQKNRPTGVAPSLPCRTFRDAALSGQLGKVPFAGPFRVPGADIGATPINGFCAAFVMKGIAGMPGTQNASDILSTNVIAAIGAPNNEPDAREQVPFEVGDFITWAGTLVRGGNNPPANTNYSTATGDLVWVHTIDANVGIYTQPRTLPAYIAIGGNGIGVDPQPTAAGAVLGAEATARIFIEASTTDVGSIVDIYYDDKGFQLAPPRTIAAGGNFLIPSTKLNAEYYRWLTPESMTGTLADQAGGKLAFATGAEPFGGGIETQYVGPQPGRARIRANKVPSINAAALPCTTALASGKSSMGCGITQSPTRYIRAVLRSLCAPGATGPLDATGKVILPATIPATNLDNGTTLVLGNWYDINGASGKAPLIGFNTPGQGPSTAVVPADGVNPGTCLERAQFANGLYTGQYMAPVGEFIFPENTLAGFAPVPATAYHLGFLVYGENGVGGGATAQQSPRPW